MSKRKNARKNETTRPSAYRALGRNDLTGFDDEATELVLEAIAAGCTGKVSANGHVILRNDTGGTAAVARHSSVQNRSAANARADVRRLIRQQSDQQRPGKHNEPEAAPQQDTTPRTLTIGQSFNQYGRDFSLWFNTKKNGIPADSMIEVDFDDEKNPRFTLAPSPAPEDPDTTQDDTATVQDPTEDTATYDCDICGKTYDSQTARNGHYASHFVPDRADFPHHTISPTQVAREHGISATTLRKRMQKAGVTTLTPETITQIDLTKRGPGRPPKKRTPALHAVPDLDPDQDPAADENAGPAPDKTSSSDAETTLRRVRQVLGEDPRIAERDATIADLETKLAAATARADEAETRLSLIQEAIGA